MQWSTYQSNIFTAIAESKENLLIEAVAGSGKSTVLVECNRLLPVRASAINVAFNKNIATDLTKKITREVATMNSVGWQIYRKNVQGVQLKVDKNFSWLSNQFKTPDQKKHFFRIQATVCRLVSLFKQLNLQAFPDNWVQLADTYGTETGDIRPEDNLEEWTGRLWDYSTQELGIADFDDQIYQVVRQEWPVWKRDVAFVDEAQDLSPMQIELCLSLGKRIVCCGDRNQSIYVFRGADINAIPNIIAAIDATCLPLSICYRCSTEVVKEAQMIVPEIEPMDGAEEGGVGECRVDEFWKNLEQDDYVLCRTTAPLVTKCLEAIRNGRKAFVRGRDIGKALFGTINKIAEISRNDSMTEFMAALNDYRITQIGRLQATGREAEAIAVGDRLDTIEALSGECDRIKDLEVVIEKIFSDVNVEGIEFSTVHKAKGREKETVYIIRSDLMPHPKAPEHLRKIEMNLKYVAITRAKRDLIYVRE